MSEKSTNNNHKTAKIFGELLGFAIGVAVLLFLMPRFSFVTESYALWLPIAIGATLISTGAKVFKVLAGQKAIKHLFEVGHLLPSIYSTYWLATIFPFDFTVIGYPFLETTLTFALLFALLVMGIATVVNVIQFFGALCRPEVKQYKKK